MAEYIMFFRMDITTEDAQPTPEQMQLYMEQWEAWTGGIAGLVGGHHLSAGGKVLRRGGSISDGPYTADRESVAGYIIVSAASLDEAVEIAKKCPILQGEGTSVEVREIEI